MKDFLMNFKCNFIGVVCHSLFQGFFPAQRVNPGLLQCRQILYCLSHREALLIEIQNNYFLRTYSVGMLEKTLMLGKIEGRRREQQRMR